jgi:parallel beta-helix repeat protein
MASITDNIIIQKSNMTIDGNGYTLTGPSQTTATAITLDNVQNVTVKNMRVIGFQHGIYLTNSNQSTITKCSISSSIGVGIFLVSSNNNTLNENNVDHVGNAGIWAYASSNNSVFGNNATSNLNGGIVITNQAANNNIVQNIASNNVYCGIRIAYSTNNIVTQNLIVNNTDGGIAVTNSATNTTVSRNNVTLNHGTGIYIMYSSTACTVTNNTVAYNSWTGVGTPGFGIDILDPYNLVAGNNVTGNVAAGIRVGASNVTVIENNFENNDYAIGLAYVSVPIQNCTIARNTIASNTRYGIYVSGYSTLNDIINNTISNSNYGIEMDTFANNNTLVGNELSESKNIGLYMVMASNNSIFHNHFINNTVHAASVMGNNTWDNGYPSGGNHWDDYNATDNYSGPQQNLPGADGVGDTPYLVDADGFNKDRYPLLTILFNQKGINLDYSGTILNIDQASYTQPQLPVSFSWAHGTNHTYSYQSPLTVQPQTKRYVWISTTGLSITQSQNNLTVPNYGKITGNYVTQYYITITSTPRTLTVRPSNSPTLRQESFILSKIKLPLGPPGSTRTHQSH